jgi:hypothetical protein
VADVGEEESFGDGDIGGVLVGGGVGGALVGVPLPANMGIAALLLVVPLTITRQRAFSDKMTGLTTFVANLFGAGLVVFPPPLLEDLSKALDDERHILIIELGGIDGDPTRRRVFFLLLRCLECNGLHIGCGGGALLDDFFGAFDHQLKAHKFSYHFLGRH